MKRVNKTRHGFFWCGTAGWTFLMIAITAMARTAPESQIAYTTAFAWWLTVIVIFGLGFIAYVLTDPEA